MALRADEVELLTLSFGHQLVVTNRHLGYARWPVWVHAGAVYCQKLLTNVPPSRQSQNVCRACTNPARFHTHPLVQRLVYCAFREATSIASHSAGLRSPCTFVAAGPCEICSACSCTGALGDWPPAWAVGSASRYAVTSCNAPASKSAPAALSTVWQAARTAALCDDHGSIPLPQEVHAPPLLLPELSPKLCCSASASR
jgi:hypothetical protein